jgi:hypothetical protein
VGWTPHFIVIKYVNNLSPEASDVLHMPPRPMRCSPNGAHKAPYTVRPLTMPRGTGGIQILSPHLLGGLLLVGEAEVMAATGRHLVVRYLVFLCHRR